MTKEQELMVEQYYDAGYIVMIGGTGYVDSPVQAVYEEENELVYDSETFDQRPLSEVEMFDVSISMPVFYVATGKHIEAIGDAGEYELKKVDGEEV